jgi:nucleotide-binding universal stress UspA family protein
MSDSTTSLKTILAPIDFSDFSNNALYVATDLASRLGAELILVNIVPAIPDLPSSVSILKEGANTTRASTMRLPSAYQISPSASLLRTSRSARRSARPTTWAWKSCESLRTNTPI